MLCSMKREPRVGEQRLDVAAVARQEVVHADDLVPLGQETLAKVGADETGAPGDDRPQGRWLRARSLGSTPDGRSGVTAPASSGSPFQRSVTPGKGYSVIGISSALATISPEPQEAPRHASFLRGDVLRIKLRLRERPLDGDGHEVVGYDELGQRRVAANVPLRRDVQGLRVHLAEDISEVEVGLDDPLDLLAAKHAEITLVAAGHRISSG